MERIEGTSDAEYEVRWYKNMLYLFHWYNLKLRKRWDLRKPRRAEIDHSLFRMLDAHCTRKLMAKGKLLLL